MAHEKEDKERNDVLTKTAKDTGVAQLSKVYEIGRGGDRVSKDAKVASLVEEPVEDVLTKTAKVVGVSERTIARAREYTNLIKERKDLKNKKVSEALAISSKEKKIEKLKDAVNIVAGIFVGVMFCMGIINSGSLEGVFNYFLASVGLVCLWANNF